MTMGMLDRLLNQDSFTEAFDKLQENHKKLSEEHETQKAVMKELADDYVRLEQKCRLLELDPEQYIETELEKRTLELEKEYAERMQHKWYGIGRQDAYREMGIRNIEAHEHGNILVQLPNGDIVEQILGLEDVEADKAIKLRNDVLNGLCAIEHFMKTQGEYITTGTWKAKDGTKLTTDWGYFEDGMKQLLNYLESDVISEDEILIDDLVEVEA